MNLLKVLTILDRRYPELPLHRVATTPFRTLIATLLSQRSRDDQTLPVAKRLFAIADTPQEMLTLSGSRLQRLIRPLGKYRQNAKRIRMISKRLLQEYDGKVPDTLEALLALPGVGRKTANIVLEHAFGQPTIAVDTHVHRISNRLGWVKTKRLEETEEALMKLIPKRYRRIVNRVFVRHGQTICTPQSPFCSKCPIFASCKRVGVIHSRKSF
ncbi:MAG: hypothetical protein A2785_00350 [Candidatus Chisholmbacteria bacterium RIFCSPHIGHO2_01_FULL_49_18]|uniref:Endonuclease III n=1 Tax=Candidatus Chisholmbacteria bacterium RIFCSPHIGHO2_01_FULL_49_18 TaxID=1797590 RepID=A0A1G1VPK3_9BACT|nr:MAG: hypothetical protein A2785_00350 [Candidatus Chisholmbacteria bacterium RIFCSPHIGHO2_01_FULL_49_18]